MTRPGEIGAIRKPGGSQLPIALVYPNIYRVGMGNLGFHFLYQHINAMEGLSAERVFLPDASSSHGGPSGASQSEESARHLSRFPVVAFSIPFENDYPAVPGMLMAAGIPPLQRDRGPADPLVIAGGVSVSMNPEPLAPFLDLAFIGEVPDDYAGSLFEALERLGDSLSAGIGDRESFLADFRDIPGVYVPSFYTPRYEGGLFQAMEPVPGSPSRIRAVKRRSRTAVVPASQLFSPDAEFGESLLVETNRGCGRSCRFCAAGWIHFPVRYRSFEAFRASVDKALDESRTIGLVGSDLAGHPELEDILDYIIRRGGRFSLSSIRPEGLTPRMIELLAATGQKTATLAPEVASPKMKRVIGKEIPSYKFLELVEKLVSAGIPNIRYYFMVGLPSESDEDAAAIVDFVLESRRVFVEASRPKGRIGSIGVQVNPFVPKPFTPFQWAGMERPDVIEKRFRIIRQGLRNVPNVKVRMESVREAAFQGFLSRGDRRTAETLLSMARGESRSLSAFKKSGLDPELHLYSERNQHEPFPWDLIDHGISREALWRSYGACRQQGPARD